MGIRCASLLCIGGCLLGAVGLSKISSQQCPAISLQTAFPSSAWCLWDLSLSSSDAAAVIGWWARLAGVRYGSGFRSPEAVLSYWGSLSAPG